MTVVHATLTGADLHEPRGIDTASANSIYVSDGAGSGDWTDVALITPAVSSFGTVSCRLTMLSGTAITEGDQSGTSLYLVPTENNNIALYDGTQWQVRTYSQLTLALDSTGHIANTNYSVFTYYDSATVKIGSGPSWISDTTTGTGSGTSEVELFEGRLVNKNPIILRNTGANSASIGSRQALLVGGFRTTSTGTTEDTYQKRLVSNVYNKYPRAIRFNPTATSWTLSTAGITTFRQANNVTSNQVEAFFVTGGNPVDLTLAVTLLSSTAYPSGSFSFGICMDAVNANQSYNKAVIFDPVANMPMQHTTFYSNTPPQGWHKFVWVEATGNSSQTVYGDFASAGVAHLSGIIGSTYN